MSAQLTVEPVVVELVAWTVDLRGYVFCSECVPASKLGDVVRELETRDVLREAQFDDPALWRCDTCQRDVMRWPRTARVVPCVVEHVVCRIF